ncbi:hypothetical protein SARC_00424 [Sphaeroforma arctica JP610]|uniref:Uncharacterized protein n=1 Tax=Sphaeroforma arctica JP610 TaxID=667725 RepID=A0A0L0GEZ8_9EUKA|nr:hypothetical protein SARC_00424 [Sphaeroforma arctica JP610]KNC87441.1 hypothetical protein SARC_00424 [Sphaeroforma arctica JP610]|eukprot:XP_014161343.1 hypothetical protein SARC_00424 [Sphaeroforma arctica JP610]
MEAKRLYKKKLSSQAHMNGLAFKHAIVCSIELEARRIAAIQGEKKAAEKRLSREVEQQSDCMPERWAEGVSECEPQEKYPSTDKAATARASSKLKQAPVVYIRIMGKVGTGSLLCRPMWD